MIEILIATWAAVVSTLSGLWGLVEVAATWAGSVLYHLHVDAPRLEGLLVGILLTWFLLRRDRHPVLRVLSAPLKLIVDILDLAWDQLVEVVSDLREAVVGWLSSAWAWVKGRLLGAVGSVTSSLRNLKGKLSKKKSEEP